ncbi:MAG: M17 family peptidase N-terminal domain-containing protein, partial [Chitinophagales bacterium]|nr:hypothetical protein [Chitinophagales bacterium]MDW8274487.1 M17 family peptidase N-terminal domain-containing protein [Chitinophagales bacterium]
MDLKIVSQSDVSKFPNLIILSNDKTEWSKYPELVTPAVSQLIKDKLTEKVNPFVLHSGKETLFVAYIEEKKEKWQEKESARKLAYQIIKSCNAQKIFELGFINTTEDSELAYAFVEGLALSAYRFDKYFTQKKVKDFSGIQKITVEKNTLSKENLDEIKILTEAVFMARNWVNEPANILTAQRLADELKKAAVSSGATAEIFDKKKIESLKMGGLLAVNSGSLDPP